MSGFAIEWLRLREPFDAAARSRDLAVRFATALACRGAGSIVDLAAGSGSNFRALAPVIAGEQDWLLVDDDALLLAAQGGEIAEWSQRAGSRCRSDADDVLVETATGNWRVRAQRLDLARALEDVDLAGCAGVTTSAFLDLVSAEWLDRLATQLARHALPFLAVLTVDGRREWAPPLTDDAHIDEAFVRDQGRDKGFGSALGGRATDYLAEGLARHGYQVVTAKSDWQVGPAHPGMLLRMVEESAAIARDIEQTSPERCCEWVAARTAQIHSGALTLSVGHVDLLAVPPGRGA